MMRAAFAIAALILSGCATDPVSTKDATPVAKDRQVAFTAPAAGTYPITITRDSGWVRSACSTDIFVEGQRAANISSGEKVTLYIPLKDTVLGAQSRCLGIASGTLYEVNASPAAANPGFYRIGYDGDGSMTFSRTVPR